MRPVGFSTGALAFSDFRRALTLLVSESTDCVELSALRVYELSPLIKAVGGLDLDRYRYISFHAPSAFDSLQEKELIQNLSALPKNWPIILHPDTIHDWAGWRVLGSQVALENMDRRKPIGRTYEEMSKCFDSLPDAQLCFDIGHARQCDPSMTEAYKMLSSFGEKLIQVHVSEVNAASQHDSVSYAARAAFREVAGMIPMSIPLIIESRVRPNEIQLEIRRVRDAIPEESCVLPALSA